MNYTLCTLIIILLIVLNVHANNGPINSPINNILQIPSITITSPTSITSSNAPSPINFNVLHDINQDRTIIQDCTSHVSPVIRRRPSPNRVRQLQEQFNIAMENASNNTNRPRAEKFPTGQYDMILSSQLRQKLIAQIENIDQNIQNASINQLVGMMLEDDSKTHDIITRLSNQNNRLVENTKLMETKDQSTSTEDLFVLEDSLPGWSIKNLASEDVGLSECAHQISTTGNQEEVRDESSYEFTTLTNSINEHIVTQVHHMRAILDVVSASSALPHNIIKNKLSHDSFMPLGVAAGSEDNSRCTGIWTSGSYSIAKQGSFSNRLPYKSRMVVMIIGGDRELSDNTIFGIAYSNAQANLKSNSLESKSHINSHILSIYSQHDVQHNFYLRLVGSAAASIMRSKIAGENQKQPYVDNILLESNITHRHILSNGMQLLPTIGLKYHYLLGEVIRGNKIAQQIIIVNHKNEGMFSSYFGTRVIFNIIDITPAVQLTPTMHAILERRMTNSPKISMTSITQGAEIKKNARVDLPSVVKNKYNLGAGLIVRSGNVKLQLDYKYSTQKSYKVYEIAMKLKINL